MPQCTDVRVTSYAHWALQIESLCHALQAEDIPNRVDAMSKQKRVAIPGHKASKSVRRADPRSLVDIYYLKRAPEITRAWSFTLSFFEPKHLLEGLKKL